MLWRFFYLPTSQQAHFQVLHFSTPRDILYTGRNLWVRQKWMWNLISQQKFCSRHISQMVISDVAWRSNFCAAYFEPFHAILYTGRKPRVREKWIWSQIYEQNFSRVKISCIPFSSSSEYWTCSSMRNTQRIGEQIFAVLIRTLLHP